MIEAHFAWWIAGAIVVIGLVIYGFGDVTRFSLRRAWAISSVSFADAIRRRVLWITPLAIVGVVLISQLQRPTDEQDAVRQSVKFCLFATGLVTTVTAVILACTNLPREIESRVIYTVVTKPTTRLEIVVGKVIGFAKVSLTILLIMGAFSFFYLHAQAWTLRRDIEQRLAGGTIETLNRPTYSYWADRGLLTARTMAAPAPVQLFSRDPAPGDSRRWFYGSGQGQMLVPFALTPQLLTPPGLPDAAPGQAGAVLKLTIGFGPSAYDPSQTAPTTTSATAPASQPASANIVVSFLDDTLSAIIDSRLLNNGQPITLADPSGQQSVGFVLTPEQTQALLRSPVIYAAIDGTTMGVEYFVRLSDSNDPIAQPTCLLIPGDPSSKPRVVGPSVDTNSTQGAAQYKPGPLMFRTRSGSSGMELRGGRRDQAPVAVYEFRNTHPQPANERIGFELRVGVERTGDASESQEDPTRLIVSAVDPTTRQSRGSIDVYPEANRTCYFDLPSEAIGSGNFDLQIRAATTGHYVGLRPDSLFMVEREQGFNWNLTKSLLILWMFSVLVAILAIFCSTFVSWPIAIVLTLVLLLGHWGVSQLGDSLQPGIGNQIATDIFGSATGQASRAKVVSSSVESLAKMLNALGALLPDISEFSAIEDIERGVSISAQKLVTPLQVLAMYGVPLLVLTYIFLRNKEVAP